MALAALLVAGSGCRERAESTPAGHLPSAIAPSAPVASTTASSTNRVEAAKPATTALRVEQRSVEGREYRWFTPVRATFALTLERPSREDVQIVLCVAGTYTSPKDRVEGVVMIDGRVVQRTRQAWQGMLRVESGRAQVERGGSQALTGAALAALGRRGVSLVQGHLLVEGGRASKLKPSAALYRRAIVSGGGPSAVVESLVPVALADFADDLAKLGAKAALNLDMGGWDEGWYRTASRVVTLGHNRSATSRQSNWLVIRASAGR